MMTRATNLILDSAAEWRRKHARPMKTKRKVLSRNSAKTRQDTGRNNQKQKGVKHQLKILNGLEASVGYVQNQSVQRNYDMYQSVERNYDMNQT
jgi:hypothetical protein